MASTKISNKILDKIISSNFTKKQLKILLLIIKRSYGIDQPYAVLNKRDFFRAGILPYHVEDEVKKLLVRGVIKWIPDKGMFWINPCVKEWVEKKRKIDHFLKNLDKILSLKAWKKRLQKLK